MSKHKNTRQLQFQQEQFDWQGDIPFQGESVPHGCPAIDTGADLAAVDAELMPFEAWRQMWTVRDGALSEVS